MKNEDIPVGLRKQEEQFKRILHTLQADITSAYIFYDFHHELSASLGEFEHAYNQSPTFWRATLDAHIVAAGHITCRIFDQEGKSLHLIGMLEWIKEHASIFSKEMYCRRIHGNKFYESLRDSFKPLDTNRIECDMHLCSNRDPLVGKLTRSRNNYFAHTGKKTALSTNGQSPELSITVKEMGDLLDRAETIFNRYQKAFCSTSTSTRILGHDDYIHLLKYVDEKVRENRSEYESLLKSKSSD